MEYRKWDDWLTYVQEHVKNGLDEVAEKIGVKKSALIAQIWRWRQQGIEIETPVQAKEGDIREKVIRGRIYVYKKIAGKWLSQGPKEGQPEREKRKPGPAPKPKIPKERKVREKKKKIVQQKPSRLQMLNEQKQRRKDKEQEKIIPTRVQDYSNKRLVRINAQTMVYADKSKTDAEVRHEWEQKQKEIKEINNHYLRSTKDKR